MWLFLKTLFQTQRQRALYLMILMLCVGGLEGIGLLLIIPLLSSAGLLFSAHSSHIVHFQFFQNFCHHIHHGKLIFILSLYCLLMTLIGGLAYTKRIFSVQLKTQFSKNLVEKIYQNILNSSWNSLKNIPNEKLSHILTTEIMRVSAAAHVVLEWVAAGCLLLIYGFLALFISWPVTILFAVLSLIIWLGFKLINQKIRKTGAKNYQDTQYFYRKVDHHLKSLKWVKSFQCEQRYQSAALDLYSELTEHQKKISHYQGLTQWIYKILIAILLSIIVIFAIKLFKMPTALLLLIILIMVRLAPRLKTMHVFYQQFLSFQPAYQAIMDFLSELQPKYTQKKYSNKQTLFNKTYPILIQNLKIPLDNPVYISNWEIPKPGIYLIKGHSGAGKTSICDILSGLIFPEFGEIKISNQYLTPENINQWRVITGYVSQESFILNDSVLNNLILAKPDALESEIWTVLKQVHLDHVFKNKPQQLNTLIGEKGLNISGGEAARLNLARILLRSPRILICDEPTAALDHETESIIFNLLDKLKQTIPIILVSHSQQAEKIADQTWILKGGKLHAQ